MKRFTLVEILVTLAIIIILISLIIPISNYLNDSKVIKAKTEMKRIQTAIIDYYNTYKNLPITPGSESTALTIMEMNDLGGILSETNPRNINFYEVTTPLFTDPWGLTYHIFLDIDYNQEIVFPAGGITVNGIDDERTVKGRVAIYSQGYSDESTNADINSWDK